MHSLHMVHVHELHGRAPLRRQPTHPPVLVQREVLSPRMAPRMKQGHDEVRLRINRREIRPLLQVATNAAQTEVIHIIWPMVLAGDDVIHLMRQNRGVLGQVAILTCPVRAALDHHAHLSREPQEAARRLKRSSA